MYDPPFLEALMITASFFVHFYRLFVVSVLLLEGTKPLAMTESGGRLPVLVGRCADSPVYS